jgi:hypothetical protein
MYALFLLAAPDIHILSIHTSLVFKTVKFYKYIICSRTLTETPITLPPVLYIGTCLLLAILFDSLRRRGIVIRGLFCLQNKWLATVSSNANEGLKVSYFHLHRERTFFFAAEKVPQLRRPVKYMEC